MDVLNIKINTDFGIINFTISYPNVNYGYWIHSKNYKDDDDLCKIIYDYFNILDCSRIYSSGRPMMTTYPIYKIYWSDVLYYLSKVKNQFLYNKIFDDIAKIHYDNLKFEEEHPVVEIKRTRKTKRKRPDNKFIRTKSKNMFTNADEYTYYNPRTKQEFHSSNGNLINEIKTKTKRKGSVPIENMTFDFSIKRK